ncbi:MAG: hypothetical protein ACE37D_09985 [Pseudomonadales bacterium]
MKTVNYQRGQVIMASLFALLMLLAGNSFGASPASLEGAAQEVILKVENMT